MAQRILVIEGSPRKGGNTDLLSDEFIRGAQEAGHIVEKIYLQSKNMRYCVDREMCQKNDKGCIQKDDFEEVCEKMIANDILVFVSPVYYYSVTAQMKTLIDRTYSMLTKLSNKECYFISSGAAPEAEYYEVLLATMRQFIGCFQNMREAGSIIGYQAQKKGEIKSNQAMDKAYDMGRIG